MNPLLLGLLGKVFDTVAGFLDPSKKAEAQLEILKLQQAGEFKEIDAQLAVMSAQTDINKVEAANPNPWVSGWRPAIGWVCATSLACYYIPYCLVATVLWAAHCYATGTLSPRPDLGVTDLIGLVTSMLGMATLRTSEKFKGVASS